MQRALAEVRNRLINLMRNDPPFKLVRNGEGGALLDQWMAKQLSQDELLALQRVEVQYGEKALVELFAEALLEAGVVARRGLI